MPGALPNRVTYRVSVLPLGSSANRYDVVVVGSNKSHVVVGIYKNMTRLRRNHPEQQSNPLLRLSILIRPHHKQPDFI